MTHDAVWVLHQGRGFLRQSIELAQNHGTYQVKAETHGGPTPVETWKSSLEGKAQTADVEGVTADQEVSADSLRAALDEER